MSNFFVQKFCETFFCLQLVFVIFWAKRNGLKIWLLPYKWILHRFSELTYIVCIFLGKGKLAQKLLLKYCWNWHCSIYDNTSLIIVCTDLSWGFDTSFRKETSIGLSNGLKMDFGLWSLWLKVQRQVHWHLCRSLNQKPLETIQYHLFQILLTF